MENSDKPFKCPKCDLCFANSDRLAVHHVMHLKQPTKNKLKVKIPGSASESVNASPDQTPTPSSFLKTADVNGSPLFQDLNPFDRDFKLASNSRQNSTVEQNPEVGSTTENRQHSVLETPQVELEDAGFPKSFIQSSDRGFYEKQGPVRSVSVIASTVADMKEEREENQQHNSFSTNSSENASVSSTTSESNQNSAALLQTFLNQLKSQQHEQQKAQPQQQKDQHQQQKEQQQQQEKSWNQERIETSSTTQAPTTATSANGTKDSSSQHELIREQLQALIKSGQIKIRKELEIQT